MTRLTIIDGDGLPPIERRSYLDRVEAELARRRMSPAQRQEQLEIGLRHLCQVVAHCDVMDLESLQRLRWSAGEFHAFLHRLEIDLANHEALSEREDRGE